MSDVNTARPRVLVADPDPETSALIARALEWSGYEVTTAANGQEALELITRLRPAAADGDGALRRRSPPSRGIPSLDP